MRRARRLRRSMVSKARHLHVLKNGARPDSCGAGARWEFWPAWLFYIPVGVHYAWLAIRHRGLSVPTSANPGIATGGFIGESKLEMLDQLRRRSPQFTAEAFPVEGLTTTDRLLCLHRICREQKLRCRFILKPDVGQRGNGVRLIRSMRAALGFSNRSMLL